MVESLSPAADRLSGRRRLSRQDLLLLPRLGPQVWSRSCCRVPLVRVEADASRSSEGCHEYLYCQRSMTIGASRAIGSPLSGLTITRTVHMPGSETVMPLTSQVWSACSTAFCSTGRPAGPRRFKHEAYILCREKRHILARNANRNVCLSGASRVDHHIGHGLRTVDMNERGVGRECLQTRHVCAPRVARFPACRRIEARIGPGRFRRRYCAGVCAVRGRREAEVSGRSGSLWQWQPSRRTGRS